jgi:ribosomal protein L31
MTLKNRGEHMLLSVIGIAILQAPVIISAPAPPRAASSILPASASIATIAIDVSAEGRPIWQGSLRVGANSGASFNQHMQQASDRPKSCDLDQRIGSSRDQFSIQLSRFRRSNEEDAVNVTASWTRSVHPVACGSYESPNRTVSLTDAVALTPSRPAQLRGDGGLLVTLRLIDRRD